MKKTNLWWRDPEFALVLWHFCNEAGDHEAGKVMARDLLTRLRREEERLGAEINNILMMIDALKIITHPDPNSLVIDGQLSATNTATGSVA